MKKIPTYKREEIRHLFIWADDLKAIRNAIEVIGPTKINADGFEFDDFDELERTRKGEAIGNLSIECTGNYSLNFSAGKSAAVIFLGSGANAAGYGQYCQIKDIILACRRPFPLIYSSIYTFPAFLLSTALGYFSFKEGYLGLIFNLISITLSFWALWVLNYYKSCSVFMIDKRDKVSFWRRDNVEKIAISLISAAIVGAVGFAAGRLFPAKAEPPTKAVVQDRAL